MLTIISLSKPSRILGRTVAIRRGGGNEGAVHADVGMSELYPIVRAAWPRYEAAAAFLSRLGSDRHAGVMDERPARAPFDRCRIVLAVGLALLPRAGVAEAEPAFTPTCRVGAKPMARLELLLGARTPDGSVGPRAWARFLATEVTTRFPDGVTVFDGHGQWRSGSRRVTRERSRLLLIWYLPDASSEARIEAIRAAYKKRFRQESVLRADSASCVAF
jgi:hypothetical protein